MQSVEISSGQSTDDSDNVQLTLTMDSRRHELAGDERDAMVTMLKPGSGQPAEFPTATTNGKKKEGEATELMLDEFDKAEGGGSIMAAVFGIIKGMVGPAILYLPRGFYISGYAVALPCMILATISYLYSANRLLQCWWVEKRKAERMEEVLALLGSSGVEYGSVPSTNATPTLLTFPELACRAFGPYSLFVKFGIALMQFGVCLTYLIFVPQNLVESIRALSNGVLQVDKRVLLASMVVIEIPLTWIRDIRKLTPINVLATFLIAFGLVSCLVIAFSVILHDPDSMLDHVVDLPATNTSWYLFIGTSFFAFEGSITLLVPLQDAVFREEDRRKFPSVNLIVTALIVVFYIIFAMICLAAFGSSVKTAMTASLPQGTLSTIVQVAYSIAVVFTFPLQAYPALQVVFQNLTEISVITRNLIASLIVCFLGLIAYVAIDYLGHVVSLLGSLIGIPVALVYPPLMHNILVKDASTTTRVMNYMFSGLGILAMGAASFTTIATWNDGGD